jgi:hypothetical protein
LDLLLLQLRFGNQREREKKRGRRREARVPWLVRRERVREI